MASGGTTGSAGGEVHQGKGTAILSCVIESICHACENESWGLQFEAAQDYQSASFELKHAALPEVTWFSEDEKVLWSAIGSALYEKYTRLSSRDGESEGADFDALKLTEVLEDYNKGQLDLPALRSRLKGLFPLDFLSPDSVPKNDGNRGDGTLAQAAIEMERKRLQTFLDMPDNEYEAALEKASGLQAGSLVKRRDVLPGYSYLDIDIEKISIKDPHSFVDPFITVSVKGVKGDDVELSQDTPVVSDTEEEAILFNMTAQIQHPLEEMPGGAAIFFEFKHFKPKKKSVSTKCFSFMGMDEIKDGKTVLEIYKKPTDFKRKKLTLLSAKPQYLHVKLTIRKP